MSRKIYSIYYSSDNGCCCPGWTLNPLYADKNKALQALEQITAEKEKYSIEEFDLE